MKFWGVCGGAWIALLMFHSAAAADLSENFDASSSVPTGWIDGGTLNDAVSSHVQSPPNCRAMGAGDTLQTPLVDYPTNLSFFVDASNGGNGNTATVDYNVNGGGWVELGSFIVNKNGGTEEYALTSAPNLSASESVRFRFNSTFSTWYLDDVAVLTDSEIPSNAPPFLGLDPAETNYDLLIGEEVAIDLLVTEVDGDEVTLSATNVPAGGGVQSEPGGGIFAGEPVLFLDANRDGLV